MIDLHTHTTSSDGEHTAKELIDMAIEKKITILGITDHDNVVGLPKAMEYAKTKEDKITVIPGVELGIKFKPGKMHMLGYYIDYNDNKIKDTLQALIDGRNERNIKFIELFNKMNVNITIEDVLKYAGGASIGKPHFAAALQEKGYIKERNEAFDKYFNTPEFKKIKRVALDSHEAIKLIKEVGGMPIIAHPKTLKLSYEELDKLICELKEDGLVGLECYNSIHTDEECIEYVKIAKKYGLIITAGSDYHGEHVKPDIILGEGKNHNIENKVNIKVYKDERRFEN